MIRVGIIGGSGYTGSRLAYHLSRHAEAEITFITSRQEAGRRMSDLYGALGGICDLPFVDPAEVADEDIDVLFTCAPDQVSMKVVPDYHDRGVRIIDLAGDYRMESAEAYERWYGAPHVSAGYIDKAVYGLTELNRDRIRTTRLVSNPGCYPTSVLLGLTPLLHEKAIAADHINVSSVSGISGAGRGLANFKLFYEADSNVLPYKHGRGHKHVGEMEQELGRAAGTPCTVSFAPHVVPIKTGIVSTVFVRLADGSSRDDLAGILSDAYADEFFVRVHTDRLPESKFVADTNFCDIGVSAVDGTDTAIVVSTICNLGKGASGQAVQNMNVMLGIDEREGLL
jgi:N-acetyl-gamma-glutamyl-phosphate reductase